MAGGLLYQGYGKVDLSGKAMPLSRVRVEFEEKFGEPPAEILDGKTCWLAGPIVNVMMVMDAVESDATATAVQGQLELRI